MGREASRTAVLVCQGRAAAHDRIAAGRFCDPVAIELLRDDERRVVEQVRSGAAPKGFAARMTYEFVRGCAAVMAPRTVEIDDAVRERATPQLVVLGAGLDARAWRMRELANAVVFEVDHPVTQADKRERLGRREPAAGDVRFVETDLADGGLGDALQQAAHQAELPTTWIWEGVVPYLTPAQVESTLVEVQARSAPGTRLVVNYQAPSVKAGVGWLIGRTMMRLGNGADFWRDEPHRSHWTPAGLSSLLAQYGFTTVRDRNLLEVSLALGLPARAGDFGGSLPNGRVLVAERQ